MDVFILNCASMKSFKGMMPYEVWYRRKPDVSFLRMFGCIDHVKGVEPHLSKLEDKITPMVFLGYEASSKTKRL